MTQRDTCSFCCPGPMNFRLSRHFLFLWLWLAVWTTPVHGNDSAQGNNPPRLIGFDGFAQATENAPIGTVIKTLTATDQDGEAPLSFRIDDTSEGANLVRLSEPQGDSTTGRSVNVILNVTGLDRDFERQERIIRIMVSDGTNEEIPASIRLFIRDVNDERPRFTNIPYRIDIKEDTPNGTLVFNRTSVNDPDTGLGSSITYSLQVDDPEYRNTFRVSMFKGFIYLHSDLDYEKYSFYQLELTATDGYGLSSTTDVIVTVIDVQDTPPTFVNTPYTTTVQEDANVGSTVITVSALDGDRGKSNNISYQFIEETYGDYFTMDNRTGEVKVAKRLDQNPNITDVFALTVLAKEIESNQPQMGNTTASILVTIRLQDINNNAPKFNQETYFAEVDENSQRNIPLQRDGAEIKIHVSDADKGANSIFDVKVMKDDLPYDVFSVSPSTVYDSADLSVQVNNNSQLDYEALDESGSNVLVFQIVATETIADSTKHTATATVSVTVHDVNDNFPQFTKASYEVNVNENSPEDTLVTTIETTDMDAGLFSQVHYRFWRTESEFKIGYTSGEVKVAANADLDREKRSQYYLTVVAEDGGGNINTTQLIITIDDVNDETPKFVRSKYLGFLQENTAFTPLVVSASDDDERGSSNSNITYSLVNVPDDLQGNFTIVTQDGEGVISLSDSFLDYEALEPPRSKIILTVVATDQGSPPQSSNATVEISVEDKNDMSPVFVRQFYSAEVNETAEGGHFIVDVSAVDGDQSSPNNNIQYSIDSGGFENFYIDPSTGRIAAAQGAHFNYEDRPVFNLSVVARDKGSPQNSGECIVMVNIKDVNNQDPFFSPPSEQFEVNENSSSGHRVGIFNARDVDATAQLVYSILVNQTKGKDENGKSISDPAILQDIREYFEVIADSGEITVKTGTLDRETAEYVEITVHVKDANAVVEPETQTATGTVTIRLLDYNDNDPEFSQTGGYRESVSEREIKGYDVITISATDKDLDRIVTFSLDDPEGNFQIDPASGKITLLKRLDRETESSHSFIVCAMDDGHPQRSSSVNVTVTVIDENDNSPQFLTVNVVKDVPENMTLTDPVITVEATDRDLGDYGAINYFIEAGNSDGKFTLNKTSGELFVVGKLDREVKSRYELRVEARDNYNAEPVDRRNNFTTVTVIVTDVNDNAPNFNRTEFKVTDEVLENKNVNSFVFTLTATDKDDGANARIRYSLGTDTNATNKDGQNLFRIEPTSGTIRVKNALVDYFGMKYLTVVATDEGTPSLSSSATVFIYITDINNYAPVLGKIEKPIFIPETNKTGVLVYTFKATDKDGGMNGKIQFELKNRLGEITTDPTFDLDENTGELITKVELDYEKTKEYTLYIQAKDLGDEPKSSNIAPVIIELIDEDDNPPKFDNPRNEPLELSIEEGRTGFIGKVEAYDPDSFNTSKICYCFIGDYPDFSLNRSTGEITLSTKIDRETTPGPRDLLIRALQYCLGCPSARRRKRELIAPPNYDPGDSTMLWVRVVIKDVNDNKPVFTSAEVSVGITRDTQYGVDILSLSEYVTDKDEEGNNTKHMYRRIGAINADVENIEGDPNEMFLMSKSGTVKTNTYFKSNWNGFFSFQVEVKDTAGNSTSSVKIYLINVDQQVKLVILDSLGNVNKSKALIVQKLENVTGSLFHIIVDKVRTHEGEDGKPDPSKMDLFIHAVNKKTKEVVDGEQLLKLIDSKIELLIDFYRKYSVIKVMPAVSPATGEEDDSHLIMAIILIAVLLGLCVVVLGSTFYICRKKYKRKLRAATAMAFVNTGIGAKESEMSKTDMPGTNLHAFEGSNPIWMEKYHDNMALDNDSQNSLDANEVEGSGQNQFDEQEVSLDLYNDDYDNFNKLPASKDLQLNAAIREHEAAKNHKNKDIVNNNAAKYAINGNVNYSNGSMNSVSSFNTKSVNGLQTTEI